MFYDHNSITSEVKDIAVFKTRHLESITVYTAQAVCDYLEDTDLT